MADLEKQDRERVVIVGEVEEEEREKLIEGMDVLDFDTLCSMVALQAQGKWRKLDDGGDDGGLIESGGGVFRMWEGEVLDCFDDRRIALESVCCPCYRFGKNMRRAGFGSCFIQGTIYLILFISAILNFVAYVVTMRRCFLYIGIGFAVSIGAYLGFFRMQIKKKYNIKGSDSFFDDCLFHLVCPCCTLCQESRTLEMNNVQGGTWHGRGDTICIGSYSEGNKSFIELSAPTIISTMQKNTTTEEDQS